MTEGSGCAVTISDGDGRVVVSVEGELDLGTVRRLEDALEPVAPGSELVIDLTLCTFLDSSAVRTLVATGRAADEAGGSLSLVATDPGILRVLEITGVDTILPVHAALDDA